MQNTSYLIISVASHANTVSVQSVEFPVEETHGQEKLCDLQKSRVLEEQAQNYHLIEGKRYDARTILAS